MLEYRESLAFTKRDSVNSQLWRLAADEWRIGVKFLVTMNVPKFSVTFYVLLYLHRIMIGTYYTSRGTLDHEDWKREQSATKHCYELENKSHHEGTVHALYSL